jgi:TPR repeat protein
VANSAGGCGDDIGGDYRSAAPAVAARWRQVPQEYPLPADRGLTDFEILLHFLSFCLSTLQCVRRDFRQGANRPREVAAMETMHSGAVQASQNGEGASVLLGRALALQATGDHGAAYLLLQRAACMGLAAAQYQLGLCLRDGRGVRADCAQALAWLLSAGAQGHGRALSRAGTMLERGQGTEADARAAAECYRRAAAQGVAAAEYRLGVLYRDGRGVDADPANAAQWLRRAATHGVAAAQYTLASLYESAAAADALYWYGEAAAQGMRPAQDALARLCRGGDGAPRARAAGLGRWIQRALDDGRAGCRG